MNTHYTDSIGIIVIYYPNRFSKRPERSTWILRKPKLLRWQNASNANLLHNCFLLSLDSFKCRHWNSYRIHNFPFVCHRHTHAIAHSNVWCKSLLINAHSSMLRTDTIIKDIIWIEPVSIWTDIFRQIYTRCVWRTVTYYALTISNTTYLD